MHNEDVEKVIEKAARDSDIHSTGRWKVINETTI